MGYGLHMVTPRERETWPKEAMFTLLRHLIPCSLCILFDHLLFDFVCMHLTVHVVLDIRQSFFFSFFCKIRNPRKKA